MRLFPGTKKWLPRSSQGRTFSQAFEKIVLKDDDIIGLIAYSFYKKSKVKWLAAYQKHHGEGAKEARIDQWASDHLTEDKIEDYRKRAFELVETYRQLEIIKANQEAYGHIASTHEKVKALTGAKGFAASVATGQISFLCSILIAGLLFVGLHVSGLQPLRFFTDMAAPAKNSQS